MPGLSDRSSEIVFWKAEPLTAAAQPSPIAATFARLRSEGRLAFIPFLAAGDPDVPTTVRLGQLLAAHGADLIEIGFPYSDPIADGPVIQAAYTRALARKLKLASIFELISELAGKVTVPLLGMVSYAIVYRAGPAEFVARSKSAGLCGLIVPDLPGDEASSFAAITRAAGLDLICLVAPTTPRERVERIVANASGFIYCIATTGTTGARTDQPTEALDRELVMLREMTSLPLCVGFGISQPHHVERLHGKADGAIVGSALVRLVELLQHPETANSAVDQIIALAQSLSAAAGPRA